MLYSGDGGTGKTSDIAAMAALGRVWIANAESGVKARALRRLSDHGIEVPIENIEVWPDRSKGEEVSFDGLEAEWQRIREVLDKDPTAYVGTGWDSITEIYKALLDSVVSQAKAKSDRRGMDRDRFFIDRADYGVMTEQVRLLVRRFRDLPCHFACSALLRREQDDDGAVTYQPAITPALQNDLIGWMDVVCVTQVAHVDGQEEYRGLFRPHSKYRGKDRLGGLPKWLVDPTFPRIQAYVDGELTADSDPVMQRAKERNQRQAEADIAAKQGRQRNITPVSA